jgi:kynureninase
MALTIASLNEIASPMPPVDTSEAAALALDRADPLAHCRDWFHIPPARAAWAGDPAGGETDPEAAAIYLVGNSLGCQPKAVRAAIEQELTDWQHLGVEAHLHATHPWVHYHEEMRDHAARLVGAVPSEVCMMNSLTVNLHMLMATFYRPTRERSRIVIEDSAFPSDSYAVQSQARFHGFDPADAVIRLRPRQGEHTLRTEDISAFLEREGRSVALLLLGGVNYLTGQWFDMPAITSAGRAAGAIVGWDLAHAAGNVPLSLHDWSVDFAAWCTYKYLNSGPGAIAGAFVHERHLARTDLVQFAGWWGNDPATRFKMGPDFVPRHTADRWAVSNPPIFSLTPVRESLAIFDRVGMPALRAKSLKLTGYLESLLATLPPGLVTSLTPGDPAQRGCALSLVFSRGSREAFAALKRRGVICDFREPNVIRAAPVPLYNTFHDAWKFVDVVRRVVA